MRKFELSKSRYPGDLSLLCTICCVLVLILSGCAGKLPVTVDLTDAQQQEASRLLQPARAGRCPDTLDADVVFNWQGYGQHRIVKATLQATRKGGFRLSGLDPLGRPFFILVTDGTRFTLVDNLQGRGYTGSVDSAFFRQYVPAGLDPSTCFSLFTARLPAENVPHVRFARTKKNNSFWFVFNLADGMTRQAELDPESGRVRRQVLTNMEKRIVLDVRYGGYPAHADICAVPQRLTVEGEAFNGSVQVTLTKLYRQTRLPEDIFTLQIPKHFIVTEVE